jgi:outer membrane protein, heavy metal efflux system
VQSAYEQAKAAGNIVDLYACGYLKQAKDSREITGFAFRQGAASLIDLLDAERTYRNTEFSYRQALANYQSAVEQLRQAEGLTR